MSTLELVIGNCNYSSWSLRTWLILKQSGLAFTETLIPLNQPGYQEAIRKRNPSGTVPALVTEQGVIAESLAIAETIAEMAPDAGLWPADPFARAMARAVSAEMHAGFMSLRSAAPMNIRKRLPGKGRGPGVDADVQRICEIWHQCRAKFGANSPFLFGGFSIADAMYAPVVMRFRTYGFEVDAVEQAYMQAVIDHPSVREWCDRAEAEDWVIDCEEL